MPSRFERPTADAATPVRFPPVVRDALANGLGVAVIRQTTVPVVTVALVVLGGTADDPAANHGLASLTGDLLDEGAGARDAIEVADAFGRLGAELEIDVGPDATSLSVTSLARHFDAVLDLVADVMLRPRLAEPDFQRVRELRISRLRQLSRLSGATADRAFTSAVFGPHPYGHGSLGTTEALAQTSVEDARRFWTTMYRPQRATLIVAGAVGADEARRAAVRAFGTWQSADVPEPPAHVPVSRASGILLVDRPGAAQSELRIGHIGPPRRTPVYHALVTTNALIGGQFTSRINRRLREEKGVTYGARSAFDLRRRSGFFSCESSVQGDRTAEAVADVLAELEEVRRDGAVVEDELAHAKASLTRGYVRHFETASQLARAAAQLVTYGLDEETFDQFVPGVESISVPDVTATARRFVRPDEALVVVVGDAAECRPALETLGRPVDVVAPEF